MLNVGLICPVLAYIRSIRNALNALAHAFTGVAFAATHRAFHAATLLVTSVDKSHRASLSLSLSLSLRLVIVAVVRLDREFLARARKYKDG
jgi:hypothetical protein